MSQQSGRQVVGNAGMYFAAYRLSQKGWNVMPTARNARGVDLLAYDTSAKKYLGIQIKTLSKQGAIPLGIKPLDHLLGDWWIIVANVAIDPVCFIMTPDEVRRGAVQDKNGARAYWLPHLHYDVDTFREAWDRIGRGDISEGAGSGEVTLSKVAAS